MPKLECLIKSRYPGKYNRDMDFSKWGFGIVHVVEGVADVSDECAAHLVSTGNFVRIADASLFADEPPAQATHPQVPKHLSRRGK